MNRLSVVVSAEEMTFFAGDSHDRQQLIVRHGGKKKEDYTCREGRPGGRGR